uniref:Protein shisa-3 homolog n=1 Tax=Saccoglossus kowalevskii TaxID=10224 RepID=A0ABM0MGH9_SACKO|nr:PREDICTED: protein shisa-3 homolog [Saccoglossus kowalevskii]
MAFWRPCFDSESSNKSPAYSKQDSWLVKRVDGLFFVSGDTCAGYTDYSSYYEAFECPTSTDTEGMTYCCGSDMYRFCCSQADYDFDNDFDNVFESAIGFVTIVAIAIICGIIAVPIIISVSIVACVYCCIKGAQSNSEDTTTHQEAPAPAYNIVPLQNYPQSSHAV